MAFREQLIETAHAYTAAHNERSVTAIKALCSPKCTHRGGPSSSAQPNRTSEEYAAMQAEVFKMMTSYKAEITGMVVDEEARKVALFIHGTALLTVGEYDNEYIITLTMTEDGKLIQDQYDFVDSVKMVEALAKMGSFKEIWLALEQNGS